MRLLLDISGMDAGTLIADKAPDADERAIKPIAPAGEGIVVLPRVNRNLARDHHRAFVELRHLIENFSAKLKQFSGIAPCYDKTIATSSVACTASRFGRS